MEQFFQQIINGLVLGSMYALIALGYTMVYGIINLINFAHGEVLMVGALTSWSIIGLMQSSMPGTPGWLILIIALVIACVVAATLINIARGGIVDDAALAAALREKRIAAAGLDVFEGEPKVHPDLLTVPNVVLTPHIASATIPTRMAMANLAADNLIAFFSGKKPLTPLNPAVLAGK